MTDIPLTETPLASRLPAVTQVAEPVPESRAAPPPSERSAVQSVAWTFESLYAAHAAFVWRMIQRLGIPNGAVEDVMQDVFLVVHRRLPEFEERTSTRAWLSAIVIRVVRAYRRTTRRKGGTSETRASVDPDALVDRRARTPCDLAEQSEAVRELYAVLSDMNEERRDALVLAELEQLSAPEIAQALQVNVNTIYWRLRTARREFERTLFRRRAMAPRSQP